MRNSFGTASTLTLQSRTYHYHSLPIAAQKLGFDLATLPYCLRVILENLLRHEDGQSVVAGDIHAVKDWLRDPKSSSAQEIAFRPARVLMQDFTGVPAVVDLAAMRDAMVALGGDPEKINPQVPVDLVIDHSVQVHRYGTPSAFRENVHFEMESNRERYAFLRWGQMAFDNFRVVPPGTGICHQVNLEYLAKVVWSKEDNGQTWLYPDSLVGTDSHTTMVNGLAVLGWGVGGIEAEAAMLQQPISMVLPEVIGFELNGKLPAGSTATDLVLTVTQMLRKKGVVGKFVEFYGEGLAHLPLADRATIANMAPEYGATCGFFPIDQETLHYLELTAREKDHIALVEHYAKTQGLWRDSDGKQIVYSDRLSLDLGTVHPCLAGPKRPQDRVMLGDVRQSFIQALPTLDRSGRASLERHANVGSNDYAMANGDVVIAAITSCTNTSNPSVLMAAGLVARKAVERGLTVKPWVKTSLAPGSQVVTEYLAQSGLLHPLAELGFNLVGYGCTTCIGNSGPLKPEIEKTIMSHDLVVASVLSGNRNFEGRIHPLVRANYLASPPLVVAYALAGSILSDITKEPLGIDAEGKAVYLHDLWPTPDEVQAMVARYVTAKIFSSKYGSVFDGDATWQSISIAEGQTYQWDSRSTYIKNPPYFDGITMQPESIPPITGASILAIFGDSITTDHISPAGSIAKQSPAAEYLLSRGVTVQDFNSYGARRGNDEVMVRGTFANIRIRNLMLADTEGGLTRHIASGEVVSIYEAAMRYQKAGTPLVVFAGKEYGTGSSRDWAAKGTRLLGIKAVIAESFERIHRSNLVGMGVLPLIFQDGEHVTSLGLRGHETISLVWPESGLTPRCEVILRIDDEGKQSQHRLLCRIDTLDELQYFEHGGILPKVLRDLNGYPQ